MESSSWASRSSTWSRWRLTCDDTSSHCLDNLQYVEARVNIEYFLAIVSLNYCNFQELFWHIMLPRELFKVQNAWCSREFSQHYTITTLAEENLIKWQQCPNMYWHRLPSNGLVLVCWVVHGQWNIISSPVSQRGVPTACHQGLATCHTQLSVKERCGTRQEVKHQVVLSLWPAVGRLILSIYSMWLLMLLSS